MDTISTVALHTRFKNCLCPNCKEFIKYKVSKKGMVRCERCKKEYSPSWGRVSMPEEGWCNLGYAFLDGLSQTSGMARSGLTEQRYKRATKDIRSAIYNRLHYDSQRIKPEDKLNFLLSFRLTSRSGEASTTYAISYLYSKHGSYSGNRIAIVQESHPIVATKLTCSGYVVHQTEVNPKQCVQNVLSIMVHPLDPSRDSPTVAIKFYNYGRFRALVKRILLCRKGLSTNNFSQYVAEVIWKQRHIKRNTREQLIELRKVMLQNKNGFFNL